MKLSDSITASRECDAEIHKHATRRLIDDTTYVNFGPEKDGRWLTYSYRPKWRLWLSPRYTTSLDAAVSLFLNRPATIPSDPLECCRAALKQRGL